MMEVFKTYPAVFAVGNTYQIMIPVTCETLMWVKIGENCYYDDSNGILRSRVTVHRICVPMAELDNSGEYTVCYHKVIERKPYCTETENLCEKNFKFSPVNGEIIKAYHISDAHNMVDLPVAAAKNFEKEYGKLDFLILNGDIPDHSGDIENFDSIYRIVSEITGGNFPTVFSRGNHDLRGVCAENLADYTPCENGNSYFDFRLGNIWGIILDCGEDKSDDNEAYGHTICCHNFRLRETKYLEEIIKDADNRYNSEGIDYKLVISHVPFTAKHPEPFNIEEELYIHWAKLLKENIKPDLMICGHKHTLRIDKVASENDAFGQPCTVVVASEPHLGENKYFAGAGFILENGDIKVVFNDNEKIISES